MSNRSLYLVTPDTLLRAYAAGIFPMAESAEATQLHWFDPPVRAIIPLDTFHVPRRLRDMIRRKPFDVRLNTSFDEVMRGCAAPGAGRPTTWINAEILRLYNALHWRKHAHAVETWAEGKLVGGIYGVSLGGAFFGESMFSRTTGASKIALVYLVALLRDAGYTLLDTQFQTPHLAQFGTYEITRANYQHLLKEAVQKKLRPLRVPENWDYLAGVVGGGTTGAAGGGTGAPLHPVTHIS